MHSRMFRNGVVTGTVTLALALGGVAVTGGAAHAAGSSADREVSSECQQARKDLSKAKKQLRKAKRSDNAAKIRKAKKRVKAEKRDVRTACADAPVTQETVLQEVQQGQLSLDGLDLVGLGALLPPEAAGAIGQLVAQLQAALDSIQSQAEVPGLETAELEALLAAVQAMDAQGVVAALQGLGGALAGAGSPEALGTLIQMLQSGLPGDGSVPIAGIPELETLLGQLTGQLGGLGAVDLTDPTQAAGAIAPLVSTLEAIAGNVSGDSAPWLGALTEMVDQLGALGVLVPGGAGSGAVLTQVLNGLLFFAQPGVDPLSTLQGILSGPGGIGSILGLIGISIPLL